MNRLVSLSEVRKKKISSKNNLLEFNKIKSLKEDSKESYAEFERKFCFTSDEESFSDSNYRNINHTKYENQLNEIMGRIFSKENKMILIHFINSVYNEDLGINTKIECIKNRDINNNNHIIILAEDEYRTSEYKIQLISKDNENIAILVTRIYFSNNYNNVINLGKKKREYEKDNVEYVKKNSLLDYDRCLIVLDSSIEVPDVYEIKSDLKNINNKIKIIKSWKYDFKKLFERNMSLLIPMKIIDLKRGLRSINNDAISKDLINDMIYRFFKDMNKYLRKVKDINLITDKDINRLNLVSIDLLNYFLKEKNKKFVNIKKQIEVTIKDIVI